MFLRLLPAVISLLVLGAHFLRRGQLAPCVGCVALTLLLALRRRWVPWLIQAALVAGTLLWIDSAVAMVRERAQHGGPVVRLALILGFVTLFTAASAWLVGTRRVRDRYASTPSSAEPA